MIMRCPLGISKEDMDAGGGSFGRAEIWDVFGIFFIYKNDSHKRLKPQAEWEYK